MKDGTAPVYNKENENFIHVWICDEYLQIMENIIKDCNRRD